MLKIAYAPIYKHPLPDGHRFPMEKYELIPQQLLYEGTLTEENFFIPKPVEEHWILRTHTADYWHSLRTLTTPPAMIRRIGFPLNRQLIERELVITQGTIDCALHALQNGIAMNVAGGTHHAFADAGEGFCLLNDIAVAANYLLDNQLAQQILVVDLDVHQGNGTAKIFENEPRVFTFSMHGASNYPFIKQKSDLDIALPDSFDDEPYLQLLQHYLFLIISEINPDFIFYQCGVDILASDKLGRLGMSLDGCKARDKFVLQTCYECEIPVVAVMGGGYSPQIRDIVEAHANTYRLAQSIFF